MHSSLIWYAENAGIGYKEGARAVTTAPRTAITECACHQGMATPHEGLRLPIRCREARSAAPGGTAEMSRTGQILVVSRSARQMVSTVVRGDELV
jgi:hypothetical protein